MLTADFDNRTTDELLDDASLIRSMKDKTQKIEDKLDENLEYLKRNSRHMDRILRRKNRTKMAHSTQMTSATTRAKLGSRGRDDESPPLVIPDPLARRNDTERSTNRQWTTISTKAPAYSTTMSAEFKNL